MESSFLFNQTFGRELACDAQMTLGPQRFDYLHVVGRVLYYLDMFLPLPTFRTI